MHVQGAARSAWWCELPLPAEVPSRRRRWRRALLLAAQLLDRA
jgi:hypothetical protein